MTISTQTSAIRDRLREAIAHFDHVLPGQAAIKDFVHHNTLHGFEHLKFPDALKAAYDVTGAYGYLPEQEYRKLYQQGRITREDLEAVLVGDQSLDADTVLFISKSGYVRRKDVLIAILTHSLKPVTGYQLSWQFDEQDALNKFQSDVSAESRQLLLHNDGRAEADAINDLWITCLHVLGLDYFILHPEELVDLGPEQAERMLAEVLGKEDQSIHGQLVMDRLIAREAEHTMNDLFARVGKDLTIAGLLQTLTGKNIMEELSPVLIRQLGSFLDQGVAAWNLPGREQGFYAAWRSCAKDDLAWVFDDLPDWVDSIDALADDPLDVVIIELKWLGLEEDKWADYLERLALELPGWSGMFLWRHQRPGYATLDQVKVEMMDYLAVRLILERLFAQRLCRQLWMVEASLDIIRWYMRHHRPEFMVRYLSFNARLPEYLITLSQQLINCSDLCIAEEKQWLHQAHMIWTWRQSPAADNPVGHSVFHSAWRLFRMAQHMGLCAGDIRTLDRNVVDQIFKCLDYLDPQRSGFIWLQAYEHHYREQLFNALMNNRGRGRWQSRQQRPQAQIVFCMDDREEGIRRHLEEHNPQVETLGAAGFFGVPINWRGLGDKTATPLCPIVVIPSHEVQEMPVDDQIDQAQYHAKRKSLRTRLKDMIFQETRRNLIRSSFLIALSAPAAAAVLVAKLFFPYRFGQAVNKWRQRFDLTVTTRVRVTTDQPHLEATPENPRSGFTDKEQADKVLGFLQTIGLTNGFSPLVVMMGHGSMSQNNPHLAAYDCGACSGRHGGPNARVFAIMANRPEIRCLLAERGLDIPHDTWFLGAEHNTCNEIISWYDTDLIPKYLLTSFEKFKQDMHVAVLGSAHERVRRFASAPDNLSPAQALKHIFARGVDFSQARPELGHATNAAAFIGRRSLSQGAFFDRRVFLISYNPTEDPDGAIVEKILLNAGPVGAGINLEYYFSTVNNDEYGCGSKITHNVTGLFGVMDGTTSDLRTGLPQQMIEIHEAMRLQVVVEASIEILGKIYGRQPVLQELVGNGWLLLSAVDPDTGVISVFKPDAGFETWQGNITSLPRVNCSTEWYQGHREPLSPALIGSEVEHV